MSIHSTEQGQDHSGIEGNLQLASTILIAGGSGLIGQKLKNSFEQKGYQVFILTRRPKKATDVFWDPTKQELDLAKLSEVEAIINLCGESIGSGRWTTQRKEVLIQSRVVPTLFLAEIAQKLPKLKYYIGASGVNCYEAETGIVYIDFSNASWSGAFTARGALIYRVTTGNPAICVLDFGSDKTSTTTFQVEFPPNTSTGALIRLS